MRLVNHATRILPRVVRPHTRFSLRTRTEKLERRRNQIERYQILVLQKRNFSLLTTFPFPCRASKIEDLEITNRSLLAINATLEATKHRQANEIRDLRRKLRESRLVLPPRAFRAIKSSLGPEDVADDEDEDEGGDDDEDGSEHDATFIRVKDILEGLLESGRRALRAEPRDFERQGAGVKVLSAEEVRSWRGDIGDDVFTAHSTPPVDVESDEETNLHRRRVAVSEDSETPPKDGDSEEAVTDSDDHSTRILPPITVTFS